MHVKCTKLINTQKRPSYAGAIYWNSLPDEIKSISCANTFKAKLKALLIDNY